MTVVNVRPDPRREDVAPRRPEVVFALTAA